MKKFFIILGILFAIVLVLGAAAFFVFQHYGQRYDADSKAYVDGIVPIICKDWDESLMLKDASPQLLEVVHKNQDQIDKLFALCKDRLGSIKEYKGSKGDSFMNFTSENGLQVTGTYLVGADFEKGSATIKIRAILNDDRWRLLAFTVNSDLLLANP